MIEQCVELQHRGREKVPAIVTWIESTYHRRRRQRRLGRVTPIEFETIETALQATTINRESSKPGAVPNDMIRKRSRGGMGHYDGSANWLRSHVGAVRPR